MATLTKEQMANIGGTTAPTPAIQKVKGGIAIDPASMQTLQAEQPGIASGATAEAGAPGVGQLDPSIQPGITRGVAAEEGDPSGFREATAEVIAEGARTFLPLAGLVGGGLVGAPSGPVGAAGGAGLGFSAGQRGADALARLLGQPGGPETLGGQAEQSLRDVIEGATIEGGGQIVGKTISSLAKGVGNIAKTKVDAVTSRRAKDLDISPKLINVVRENSPAFQAASSGQVGERELVRRAKDAATGARKNIGDRFRGELQKLGIDDPIDLRVPQKRVEFVLEKFGLKRNAKGKLTLGERRGGLNPTEQSKLKEVVDKIDDKLADSNTVSLDNAEFFRQELRDTVDRLAQNPDITRKGSQTLRSIVKAYEDGINSIKPGYSGIAKKFRPEYEQLSKDVREIGLTSDRVKDSSIASRLRLIAKRGDDIPLQSIGRLETLSGQNISDIATGNQIAKSLEKADKTSPEIKRRIINSLKEFRKPPAERLLKKPEAVAENKLLSSIAKGAQPETESLINSSIANFLRGTLATQERNQ